MHFDWWTLGLQTVNFTVLVWLLHHFLYKPVLRMIDARRAEIEKQYADASAAESRAKDQLAAIEAKTADIAVEREAALEAARAQAEEVAETRRAQAEAEAKALLDAARKTIAAERDKALVEMRKSALDLGTDIARRLLAEVPETVLADAWFARIEQYLTSLPDKELKALVHQIEDGAVVSVATAASLAPATAEAWRARLCRFFGEGINVAFDVDPALIAGVEIHFPSAVLRFSWQNTLAAVRAEVEA